MLSKKVREMYINEVPFHDITHELKDAVLMLYDDTSIEGMMRIKPDLRKYADVISGVYDLSNVLNEKAKKSSEENYISYSTIKLNNIVYKITITSKTTEGGKVVYTLVINDGNKDIGFLECWGSTDFNTQTENKCEKELKLAKIYVAKDERNKGIATEMLKFLCNYVDSNDREVLKVYLDEYISDILGVMRLYKRFGFEQINTNRDNSIVMVRKTL